MGGSLWLSLKPDSVDPSEVASNNAQLLGNVALDPSPNPKLEASKGWVEPKIDALTSPHDLNILSQSPIFLHLRMINLSPVTDLFVRWKSNMNDVSPQTRCPIRADLKSWQEITCFIDVQHLRPLDQIYISIPKSIMRGDLWINAIDIGNGLSKPVLKRPNLAGGSVVPTIHIPGLSQRGFADAFQVLEDSIILDVPVYGFTYPVTSPAAHGEEYGENWWPLDASLAIAGAKWSNQNFVEDVMKGFHDVQESDGRIPGLGFSGTRGQVGDFTQLPRLFEVAYDVARRSNDSILRTEIYETMRRYLDWWLSPVKRDGRTGLVSGVGEETFNEHDPFSYGPQSRAQVDTNVAVAVGAKLTARLAKLLGRESDEIYCHQRFLDLSKAINDYLWDDKDGIYYNLDLISGDRMPRLIVSTFDTMRLEIAPPERRARLVQHLLNSKLFNWGHGPLTGLAKTEPDYQKSISLGQFNDELPGWFGDITTLRNLAVIKGLSESGLSQLAAELNWATIRAFHANYSEHLFPNSNRGDGAKHYAWSAGEYIEAVIDHLFGIDVSAVEKRIKIVPLVPKSLYGKELKLENLILPSNQGARMSLRIKQESAISTSINVDIKGQMPEGTIEIGLPGKTKTLILSEEHSLSVRIE